MSSKNLGLKELLAIAIGGMVGGGIFTILGISVSMIGYLAPYAIALGGVIAFLASYAYVKLALYYRDEGATYAFFKRTYPSSHLAASIIGYYTIFGYISTLALYAYTFSSYTLSSFSSNENIIVQKIIAITIIWIFALINIWSTKGMGKIEDILVYTKIAILAFISVVFIYFAPDESNYISMISRDFHQSSTLSILIVASITFVAYEGFQLVVNGVNEMKDPSINIPKAIYSAIILVSIIYFIIALSATMAIPLDDLIKNREYALASGAYDILGRWGKELVILGAILATSSAISGTLFGASRQISRIAEDNYMPNLLSKRANNNIPIYAILTMALLGSLLILSGGLVVILEFGSITFLLVSLLMAIANFKIRKETNSSTIIAIMAIIGLSIGAMFILYYEYTTQPMELVYIVSIYLILTIIAYLYAYKNSKKRE
jgi:amino acid transporter